MNKKTAVQIDPREKYLRKIQSARIDIIIMIMLTIINSFLLFTESQTYFFFSAFIPYRIILESAFYTGKMPAVYYESLELEGELEFLGIEIFYIAVAIAAVILGVYLLCFFLSKTSKKALWFIIATVIFAADTVYLLSYAVDYGVIGECVFDILIHAYVLYGLISGVISSYKLKDLPELPEVPSGDAPLPVSEDSSAEPTQNDSDIQ